jgi:single-stranded DNA-binding protein
MFNFCVVSGRIITEPMLKFYGKDNPVTQFTLEILIANYRWIRIKVRFLGRLAVEVAKHLRLGNRVAVAGFISWDIDMNDLLLDAHEVEVVSEMPIIEPESFGEDQQS